MENTPFGFGQSVKKMVEGHDGLTLLKEHYNMTDYEITQAMKQGLIELIERKQKEL